VKVHTIDPKAIAEARKAGRTDFAARMLAVKPDELNAWLDANVGKSKHAQLAFGRKGDATRRVTREAIRKLSDKAFQTALKDGSFEFLAHIYQRQGTGAFEAMRKRESYGFTEEQRENLSTAMRARNGGAKTERKAQTKTERKAKTKTPRKAKTVTPEPSSYVPQFVLPNGFAQDVRKSGIVEAFRKAGKARTAAMYARAIREASA
jgi:hypothetical protein